ncbi:MAG: pyridoxamine kinase [Oscillospiraceae bacterium]|nr:pyridoxamine kinase [Oscillospiraceae bacterium]
MSEIKKTAAIHDMSGFGRCSLTVIIPVLSAMSVQVCPVPTAVLATHTGGFGAVTMQDLTGFMPRCLEKYRSLEIGFDAVYSGFLATEAQIDHCLDFFRCYSDSLKVVDPVMGDHGRVYSTYTPEMCKRMGELARAADVITPNLTEAAILLGEDYAAELPLDTARDWITRLLKFVENVVITGVKLEEDGEIICLCANNGGIWRIDCDYVPQNYPGTGDIFAAVLTGGLLKGDTLQKAASRAAGFTEAAVKATFERGTPARNGVIFEEKLHLLTSDSVIRKTTFIG